MSILLGIVAGIVTFDVLVVALLWFTGRDREDYPYEGSE